MSEFGTLTDDTSTIGETFTASLIPKPIAETPSF